MMIAKFISCLKQTFVPALLFLLFNAACIAATLDDLAVEYTTQPLGIDVQVLRFSWKMNAPESSRGYAQSAYNIKVTDPSGDCMWDSGKVVNAMSVGIAYAGSPLKPTTRYQWKVTVWDQKDGTASGKSWFETGLMNPAINAWDGATWIGGGPEDLVLFSKYLPIYVVRYKLTIPEGSTRAAFVFGANDPRLMDKNKNAGQLASPRNGSFIKLELDVAGVDGSPTGMATLNIYRAGYAENDDLSKPLQSLPVGTDTINAANKNIQHAIAIHVEYGQMVVTIDGQTPIAASIKNAQNNTPEASRRKTIIQLNPLGRGTDYITFGMLADIGFAADPGQHAEFSDLEISHIRKPGNILFKEDLSRSDYEGIFHLAVADPSSGLSVRGNSYNVAGGPSGAFITADPSRNAMPVLRTKFATQEKPITAARLYITARGIYEAQINGRRVGNDYYNPGLTQYNKTHFYQTYDVTALIKSGENALGALLGEGWWSGQLSYGTIWNHFGDRPSLLAKLVITYKDGSGQVVATNDSDWKVFTRGPIVYSSLNMGEIYDATRELAVKGWSGPEYDDRAWKKASEVPLAGTTFDEADLRFDHPELQGQIGDNARVFTVLTAKNVQEVRPGVFVYDLGQNVVGVPRISFADGKAGRTVTLRYAEMLYPNLPAYAPNIGMIMTENYRAALSQDQYTQRDGTQVYQPYFTSHGFQYIEITGLDKPLPVEAVQGVVISSIRSLTAEYSCSNPLVNKLWSNLTWSNIDNFLTLPTDCPQRNERMGWSGDISVFSRTATYVSNADQFLRRHMVAMRDVQSSSGRFTDVAPVGGGIGGVLWGSAGITVPWECYLQYGDAGLLAEHYEAMAAYVRYLKTTINPKTGFTKDAQLGDWLGLQNFQLSSVYLATAYHIFDLGIMTQVAELLHKPQDAAEFREMYNERKAFFSRTFINENRKTISPKSGSSMWDMMAGIGDNPVFRLSDTQSAYAVGLALDAFSDDLRDDMAKNLAATVERENIDDSGVTRPKYSLMTGFIGTAWISEALSGIGRSDLAYQQLQTRSYPAWLYSIDQGSTTIWERLNSYTIESGFGTNNWMNSFNHYSFGAVGQWLLSRSLGIARGEPGFRTFVLRPEPDPTGQMTWAKGSYNSMYGEIVSDWKIEKDVVTYNATVPANTVATLYLPTRSAESVTESGKPAVKAAGVTFLRSENGKAVYELKAGQYEFTARR